MDTRRLTRLITLDALLAGAGLHLPSAARELGVTVRTVWRDLDALRLAGCEIECRIVENRHLHFHVGERLFNPHFDRMLDDAVIIEFDFEHVSH